jgi:hypothetical protein
VDRALAKRASDADFRGDERQVVLDDSGLERTQADVKTEIRPADGGQDVQVTAKVVYPTRTLRQVAVERNYTLPNTSGARANRR